MYNFILFALGFNILFVTVNASCDKECNRIELGFYEDNACIPKYDGEACPSHYECPEIVEKEGKCFYSGKYFENGESVKPSQLCHFCSCFADGGEKGSIACAMPKCFVPSGNDTCYYPDSLDKCCPGTSLVVCGPRGSCNISGNVYKEGEKFFPENSCLTCLCSKEDNYKFNKASCKRQVCDIVAFRGYEDFKNFCAPTYYEKSACCPEEFTCPEDIESTTQISNGVKGSATCKFGNKNVNKGYKFTAMVKEEYDPTSTYSITCECALPPYLTCIRN